MKQFIGLILSFLLGLGIGFVVGTNRDAKVEPTSAPSAKSELPPPEISDAKRLLNERISLALRARLKEGESDSPAQVRVDEISKTNGLARVSEGVRTYDIEGTGLFTLICDGGGYFFVTNRNATSCPPVLSGQHRFTFKARFILKENGWDGSIDEDTPFFNGYFLMNRR